MKILIINYYYPPVGRAHSYRWAAISDIWCKDGHEVVYITSKSHQRRERSSVRIVEAGPAVAMDRFNREKPGTKRGVLGRLRAIAIKIYRFLYWPDGLWYWTIPLLLKLYKHRNVKYDMVISYSPTFVAHIGGFFYKKIVRYKFEWIVDYGDPFSVSESMQPNNYLLYGGLNAIVERTVLREANKVVFTNDSTIEEYRGKFPDLSPSLIPHGVRIEEFYSRKNIDNERSLIKLVYVGSFHRGIREPVHAIDAINEFARKLRAENLAELSFDIYGPQNGVELKCDGVVVKYHGSIPREQAIAEMMSADFLVNIENVNCVMSPSKAVEYLATGIPIINFHQQQVTAAFFGAPHVLHVQKQDYQEFKNFIFNAPRQISRESVERLLESHTYSYIAKKYLDDHY